MQPAHDDTARLRYRPDIDGLRALAVLAVVGFHAFPHAVRGGFVGVDVFFVVSGFLITGLLLGALDAGTLSLRDFYARRVRRLFPALAIVLLASLAMGWYLQAPADYAALGKHVLGGAAFVSNIVLWQEAGYFDAAAAFKPLLHLWSLGVEEQFYLVWPPLLLLAAVLRWTWLRVAGALVLLSFVASLWWLGHDASGAFFLPWPRLWEFGIGALLARGARGRIGAAPAWLSQPGSANGAALIGLALLASGIFGLQEGDAFPGVRALLPVLGTALLIAAGPDTWAGRALSWRPIVLVGLISYPMYLWHWPLLSFARIQAGGEIAPLLRVALVVASGMLAWLTWHLVETPIRQRRARTPGTQALLVAMAFIAMAGALVWRNDGVPSRAGDALAPYLVFDYDVRGASREGTCAPTLPEPLVFPPQCVDRADARPLVALWGDSHAAMLYPGLRAADEAIVRAQEGQGFRMAQFTRNGCRPFLHAGSDICQRSNAQALRQIAAAKPDYVLLFSHWNHVTFTTADKLLADLEPAIAALHAQGVPRIVVVGPAPRWKDSLPASLVRLQADRPFLRVPLRTRFGLESNALQLDAYLQSTLGKRKDITYFSVIDLMCDARGCLTHVDGDKPVLTTWDYGHLALPAATYVATALAESQDDFSKPR